MERFIGLGVRESLLLWNIETSETRHPNGDGIWWKDVVQGFKVLNREEIVMEVAAMGPVGPKDESEEILFAAQYESVCINIPRYLTYLMERVTALGGRFVVSKIDTEGGVEGVVDSIKRLVTEQGQELGLGEVDAVVLATGLLSRHFLPKEEADKLYPVRGQTVLVKGEASKAITEIFANGEISYVIPRPGSGTTILGGCKEVGNWNEKEDRELTKKILRRAEFLVPELLSHMGREKFEVLSVQVGRRPGRKGGPRVEIEEERIKGVRLVYAYGYEGAGYQNSIGSAGKVVGLLAAR
jgi:glycine/D-amino acid oxidase-like deaminating enzyme